MASVNSSTELGNWSAIARKIGITILSGKIEQGAQLDGEIEASQASGVSRTAYREAIRILVAKGLLESRPKAGTRVTNPDRWNRLDPDLLAWTFSGNPDPAFIQDLFELRRIVEPAVAALAAKRRTSSQIEGMRSSLAEMQRYGLADKRGQQADLAFHRIMIEAAGNSALTTLADSIGAAVAWTTIYKQRYRPLLHDPVPDHAAVLDAIEAAESEAASDAMTKLIAFALADMDPGHPTGSRRTAE